MSLAQTGPSDAVRRPGPEAVAAVSVAVLTLAAWMALFAEAVLLAPDGATPFLEALCRPLGASGTDLPSVLRDVGVAAGLWAVMSVAMMLPTAVPMVFAFVDQMPATRRRASAPVFLVAGYLGVWLVVSVVAAVLQVGTGLALRVVPLPGPLPSILAGVMLGAAGFYQFSDRKLAFLSACRHPFPAGIADPLPPAGRVFAMGVEQGRRCLGCCGAMMATMLVSGTMNLAWMGGFAVLMTVEKLAGSVRLSRAIGILLVAAGLAVAVAGVGPERVWQWAVSR
ncbi:DUF2182 domain-containing protein [Alsobacter sp. R-9]